MELTLKVTSGKHAGQKLRVPAPKFLIGRGDDCQLRPNSDLISRHHCVLFVGTAGAIVRDLNSRNGTFVNDERISGDRPLAHGDRLSVGQLTFEVRIKVDAPAPPKALDLKQAAEKVAAKTEGDLDVLELFKDEPAGAMRDTVRLEASETIATRKESLVEEAPSHAEGAGAAEAAPAAEAADESGVKQRRHPTKPLPQQKDGGEAAAQILRQFLKGR
jgi:pSer/pThr/pTyr-binding forkhead associated (FHA) protein